MRSLSRGHLGENAEREDFFDDAQGLDVCFDAVIGKFVGRQAIGIELAKTGFVAKERAIGDVSAAREEFFDGAVKPDECSGIFAEESDIIGLRGGAAAERNDTRLLKRDGFADCFFQLLVLDLAEGGLPEFRKNRGDRGAGGFGDEFIEIDVLPTDLASEQARDGGLAAAHKASETDEAARTRVRSHECGAL